MAQTGEELWIKVRDGLQAKLSKPTFETFIRPTGCSGFANGELKLLAPNPFASVRLREQLLPTIAEMASSISGQPVQVTVLAETALPLPDATDEASAAADAAPPPAAQESASAPARNGSPRRYLPGLNPRYVFGRFVVGPNSRMAHAAALAVAEAPGREFNPLFICGGVGLGKTHLMQAIGHYRLEIDPGARVAYVSTETFTNDLIQAIRKDGMQAFRDRYRAADLILVDDIQFIEGKEYTQEEFFHTFNALCDQNRQIVISGDRSPADLEGMEERMRSRLGWGLVADIHPTDYELRLSILQSKVEQLEIDVPRHVLEFLAHRITANVRELEGALNRVAAFASLVGRPVEMEMAQEVLRDLLRASDRRITIEEIQKRVAEHYNIKQSEMHSARRAIAVARPRQIAMYLAKHLTTRSLPEIGRKFGNRDHTTVMHAVKRIEELQGRDPDLAEDIVLLKRTLES